MKAKTKIGRPNKREALIRGLVRTLTEWAEAEIDRRLSERLSAFASKLYNKPKRG